MILAFLARFIFKGLSSRWALALSSLGAAEKGGVGNHQRLVKQLKEFGRLVELKYTNAIHHAGPYLPPIRMKDMNNSHITTE